MSKKRSAEFGPDTPITVDPVWDRELESFQRMQKFYLRCEETRILTGRCDECGFRRVTKLGDAREDHSPDCWARWTPARLDWRGEESGMVTAAELLFWSQYHDFEQVWEGKA